MARQTEVVFVLLLAMAATGKKKQHSCCPDGWVKFDRRCFKYEATSMDWASAEKYCLNLGANLISIHSEDEYQWFKSFVLAADPKNNPTWIGLYTCQKVDHWYWSDGTKLIFTKWSPSQPDLSATECCVLWNW
ncbi:hypothetical protein PDJAM_G00197360, partial [Pangasius djambal]|nr:hypothetical protein [Pangasius djambal]